MRNIKVVFAQGRGRWPVLLLATVGPAAASATCSSVAVIDGTPVGGGAAAGGATGGDGGFGFGGFGGNINEGGHGECEPYGEELTFNVQVPAPGQMPDEICQATAPVESNQAALISLTKDPQSLHLATGTITLDSQLEGPIIGDPTVEVVEAIFNPQLLGMQVSNIQPTAQGFSFDAQWPQPFDVMPDEWAGMKLRTTMQLQCPNTQLKTVQSHTYVNLCIEQGETLWVSSGGECTVCSQVCEMAPGPALADAGDEDLLPLARALKLAIVPVARVGRSAILLAENDGGEGLEYRWKASAGEVRQLAPDLVVWTLPDDRQPQLMRVAAIGSQAVAAASFAA